METDRVSPQQGRTFPFDTAAAMIATAPEASRPRIHRISSDDLQASAGPSRIRRRHSDSRRRQRRSRQSEGLQRADHHWLSEDEGGDLFGGQPETLHHRDRVDDDDPFPSDRDDDPPDPGRGPLDKQFKMLPAALQNGHSHRLTNRPAKLPDTMQPGSVAPLPGLPALLSVLQAALECAACRDVLTNPITLVCGHTMCSSCTALPTKSQSTPSSIVSLPAVPPMSRSESTSSTRRRRSSSIAAAFLPEWFGLGRRTTHDPLTSPNGAGNETPPLTAGIFGRASGSANLPLEQPQPKRPMCPRPGCREGGHVGVRPKTDVVLQKLVALFVAEAPDRAPLTERFRRLTAHAAVLPAPVIAGSLGSHAGAMSAAGTVGHLSGQAPEISRKAAGKGPALPPGWSSSQRTKSLATEAVPEDGMEDIEDAATVSSMSSASSGLSSTFVENVLAELECQVCAYTFVTPVTTPCGHTFCRQCLMRSLDHSDKCPLCRDDLPPYAFFANHAANASLLRILQDPQGFQAITEERVTYLSHEDLSNMRVAPIFVCSLSFPALPTFLHVFEPRYRLMMRRAMETDRRFGMVLPQRAGRHGLFDYGTMLEIRNIQMLPDGRSVVETVGVYRFRVLEGGMLDGYHTAKIERIDDIPPEEERDFEAAEMLRRMSQPEPVAADGISDDDLLRQQIDRLSTEQLMATCQDFFDKLRSGSMTAPWLYQRLNNTFGPMPDNAAQTSYWLASVLPIDDYQKAQLLPITSPRIRLRLVVFWIEQMRGKWWYGNCSIM